MRLLSACEIALGSALLVPIVPAAVAGAGLTAFSGGLLGLVNDLCRKARLDAIITG